MSACFAETYFIGIGVLIRSFRACGHNKLCTYVRVLTYILGIKIYTEFTTLIYRCVIAFLFCRHHSARLIF